jgi:pimeloyl-ACP methyl ester carboxylesterase
VPTLLVVGEREQTFVPLRAYAEATIRELRVVATPAGHAVNIEAAAAFDAAVTSFVTSLPS